MASAQRASSTPVCSASCAAASSTLTGIARRKRPVSGSVSNPNTVSIQPDRGSAMNRSRSYGGSTPGCNRCRSSLTKAGSSRSRSGVVRVSVSPMIRSGFTSAPKIFVATRATDTCCSAKEGVGAPSSAPASVADVPTTCIFGFCARSRTRRTSNETSAPCRPRYVCSSSRTKNCIPRICSTNGLSSGRVKMYSSMT